jgi:hypothetical protein
VGHTATVVMASQALVCRTESITSCPDGALPLLLLPIMLKLVMTMMMMMTPDLVGGLGEPPEHAEVLAVVGRVTVALAAHVRLVAVEHVAVLQTDRQINQPAAAYSTVCKIH